MCLVISNVIEHDFWPLLILSFTDAEEARVIHWPSPQCLSKTDVVGMDLIYVLDELPGSTGVGGLEVRVEYGHYVWGHHHPDRGGGDNFLTDQNTSYQAI